MGTLMNNDELILEILRLLKRQNELDKQNVQLFQDLDKRVGKLEHLALGLNSSLLDLKLDLARQDGLSEKDIN